MRVATVCSAFAFAVLTALPDTTGAPTSDVALVSGSKALSVSSESTLFEEDQKHVAQEATTAAGTTKVDQSVKKKISVKVSEQQHSLFYYVVSYKKLPKQKGSETKYEYYKRVFPKEDNLKVFYRKVFKCYEGEDPKQYTDRVEYIFDHIYPELDCRLDVKWLEQFDHYYTLEYCRKWDEPDAYYYARILKKLDGECNETYKKRMECLVAALDEEDFDHITFDDSELGYSVGERKTPCTSVSTPKSTAQVTGTTSTNVKSKSSEVDVDKSVTSVEAATDCSSSTTTVRKQNKKETSIENEITTTSSSYKVAYTELPVREPGQLDECYYKNFFGTYDDNITEEKFKELMLRIFIVYKGESTWHYCHRVDYLFNHVYAQFDVRFDEKWLPLTEYYYRMKYALLEGEGETGWFERVLLKEQDESAEHYINKVKLIKQVFKSVNWSLVSIDENSCTGYTLVSEQSKSTYSEKSLDSSTSTIYIQRGVKETIDHEDIKNTYAKNESEDYLSYYQRLTAINTETIEDYIVTLTSIRACFTELDLWYEMKYFELIKEYYTKLFTKQSCESYEQYFERIIKKYSFETDFQCAKRINIIQHLFSNLDLWSNKVYYEKFTKAIYQTLYSKLSSENDDTYYERITQKLTDECDTAYVKRLQLIKLTHSSLDLWYNTTHLVHTSKYYTVKYTQGESETIKSYYDRIVKKETEETDEQCACRVELVRSLFPNMKLWHEEKYYESYTKPVYQLTFSKQSHEDDSTYYERITKQTSGEADVVYTDRIYLVKRTFSSLPLWYSSKYLSFTTFYYAKKYTKCSKEEVDVYYNRIVQKEALETDEQCANRVEIIHSMYPTLTLWYDEMYYKTLTHKIFQITYKKNTEDENTYYLRLVSQLPNESDTIYLQRMNLVKRTTNTAPIWYSASYLDLTSKYYIAKYAKADSEEWEDVYERIVAKEFDETDEQCAYRVEVVRNLNPNLLLWSLDDYYVKYIKKHYTIIYKKTSSEDERSYFSRICNRFPLESDLTYVGRLDLVMKTYSMLSLWHSSDYLDLLYNYIKIKYIQDVNESDETYIARLVAKADCDTSDLIYAQRIHLIHRLTVSSAAWYLENLYDAYTNLYYSTYYAKGEDECCETWLKRVITQLDGECDESAIKRIALIKKSTSECGCWTVETLEKIQSDFTSEYYEKVKNSFCITEYTKTTMESSSSSSSESENSSEEIFITRG